MRSLPMHDSSFLHSFKIIHYLLAATNIPYRRFIDALIGVQFTVTFGCPRKKDTDVQCILLITEIDLNTDYGHFPV